MIWGQSGHRTRNGSNGVIFCREPEIQCINTVDLILIMLSLVPPISE